MEVSNATQCSGSGSAVKSQDAEPAGALFGFGQGKAGRVADAGSMFEAEGVSGLVPTNSAVAAL